MHDFNQTMENILDKNFWETRYQSNETQWDLNKVSPPLQSIIDSIDNKNISILIPGCGNAHEAEYLVNKGFSNVTVVDIAPSPVEILKQKFTNEELKILCGDFFQHHGKYDLILEQTFLCALNRDLRKLYAKKCFELLNENGMLAGVLFNVEFDFDGPPFGGSNDEYKKLFEPFFNIKKFESCTNSIEKRRGHELNIQLQKKKI